MTNLVQTIGALIGAIAPVVDIVDPALGPAVTVAAKLLAGVAAAEPTAVSLYQQISTGQTPTESQMLEFAANYDVAYSQLDRDLGPAA